MLEELIEASNLDELTKGTMQMKPGAVSKTR